MTETLRQLNILGLIKVLSLSINYTLVFRRETIVKIISVSTGTSYVYIITSKFGHVGIYDDKLRLQRRYEIDIDTDPDSDLDVAASDPGWITDAVWMDNSKHMVYTSSLRLEQQLSRYWILFRVMFVDNLGCVQKVLAKNR